MKKFSLQIAVLAFAGSLCGALYASEPSVPFASSLGPTNLAVELASDDVHVGPVQFDAPASPVVVVGKVEQVSPARKVIASPKSAARHCFTYAMWTSGDETVRICESE